MLCIAHIVHSYFDYNSRTCDNGKLHLEAECEENKIYLCFSIISLQNLNELNNTAF